MAVGGLGPSGGKEFEAKITPIVIISCIMAATGGLMFGYDVGVSGKNRESVLISLTYSSFFRQIFHTCWKQKILYLKFLIKK